MKKHLCYFYRRVFHVCSALVILNLSLNAQSYHLATHSHKDIAGLIRKHHNGFYWSKVVVTNQAIDSTIIYNISNTAEIKFKKRIYRGENTRILDMRTVSDGGVVFAGVAHGCDYTTNQDPLFFTKLDSSGQIVFNIDLDLQGNSYWQLAKIEEMPDGSFYVFTEQKAFQVTANGIVYNVMLYGFPGYKTFTTMKTDTFVCATNDSMIVHFEAWGGIMGQQKVNDEVTDIQKSGQGTIFCQMGNKIKKYTQAISQLDSLVMNPGQSLRSFDLLNDTLYISGVNNGKAFILTTDTSFNLITQFTASTSYLNPVSISGIGAKRAAVSFDNQVPHHPNGNYCNATITDLNGFFQYQHDIGVTHAVMEDGYYSTNFSTATVKFIVTVKNFGTDTIFSYYVNANTEVPTGCGKDYLHKYVTNLPLAPQQSATLNTGYFSDAFWPGPGTTPASIILPKICLYTTLPNLTVDSLPENDLWCSDVLTVPVFVGIRDEQADTKLEIYPNPFENELRIESEHQIKSVELSDLTGRSILILGSDQNSILLNDLKINSGLYLIRIQTDKGITTKKVVKN